MHEHLILTRTLRAAGDTTRPIERAARQGAFVRVRPGAYVPTACWNEMDAATRHRVAMDAYAATSRRDVVFALESAATLLGIPVIGSWPTSPRVIVTPEVAQRARVGVAPRWRSLGPGETMRVGRVFTTTPWRTALDLAAERELVSGVSALDHVLRTGDTTNDELRARLTELRPFRGARKADAALGLATGRAESPLESLSLVRIAQLGFEPPEQQVEFRIDGRTYRVDFYWPGPRIVGEADGRTKYDERAPEVVVEEKEREDALRSVVAGFARWRWSHAWAGEPLAVRLERAGLRRTPRNASRHAFRT